MDKNEHRSGQRVGKGLWITGIVFFMAQLCLSAGLIAELILFPILSKKYMLLLVGVLVLLLAVNYIFLVRGKSKVLSIIGIVLAALLMAACLIGVFYFLEPARKTLQKGTGKAPTETIAVDGISVLVRTEDTAKDLSETAGYVFGIQRAENYADSLAAFQYITNTKKINATVREYEYYEELVTALENGEVNAILADSAYVVMLEDYNEGFEEAARVLVELSFEADIKDIAALPTPTPVPTATPMPTPTPMPTAAVTGEVTPEPTPEPTQAPTAAPTPTPYCTPFAMPSRGGADITSNYYTVYFSGIDRYGDISVRSRSDVNIVMTVNPLTHRILLVTIPRDAYVIIPGISGGSYDKLTHAGIYGVKASMSTLEQVYGIKLDYYVRVNFTSVVNFIDVLGGVDVYSAYDFSAGGYSYKKGMNHVNGAQGLAFARERYAFAAGDHQRGRDQMELIKAVINKMVSPAILSNFSGIMDAISGNFQTNLTMEQLTALCRMQLDTGASWSIETYAVSTIGDYNYCYSYKGSKLYVGYPVGDSVREATAKMREVMEGH